MSRAPEAGPRSGPRIPQERAVLLILLVLVALAAAWVLWNNSRSTDELAQAGSTQTPPTGDPAPSSAETTPPQAAGSPTPADGTGGVTVQSGGEVEVPSIPAFGETGTEGTPDAAAEPAPTPGGINPDTALATLPGVNPFRPLALPPREGEATPSTPAGQTDSPIPVTPEPARIPSTPAVSTPAPVPSFPEPDPVTPLPGPAGRVTVSPPVATEQAVPTLPDAGRTAPSPAKVTVLPPPSTPRATPPAASVTDVTSRPPSPVTVPVRPTRPPVAGVSVPRETSDLTSALGRNNAGNSSGASSTAVTAPTALPTPGTPQPITRLGGDSAAAPTSALDRELQDREVSLNAAVLGPVNTAIFRSRDGFVVVEAGQKLPDSDVVLQEVTADSVTLALGDDTTTLQVNER